MFEIDFNDRGEVVICGRLDAAQAKKAQDFLDAVHDQCIVDLGSLEYISSAGLGVLLKTHKRLMVNAVGLKLVNVNPHTNDIFRYSGFDRLFEIEVASN